MPAATRHRETALPDASDYLSVALERIEPSEDNPRHDLGNLDELVKSIQHQGILEPLIVAPKNEKDPRHATTHFDIIAGHRRYAAAQLAGLRDVPVIVRPDLVGARAAEARLVENLQRTDLTPIEEARAYEQLIRLHGYRQTQVAAAIGRNQGHVSKRLSLLRLPAEAQDAVSRGQLPVADAVELAKLPADGITRALHSINAGTDPSVAIRNTQAWAEKEADRRSAVTSLQKQGVIVHQMDVDPKWNATEGPMPLKYMEHVDFDEHARMECHGAVVGPIALYTDNDLGDPVDRWAIFVCTTPTNHPRSGPTPQGDAEVEAARRERAERAARLQAVTSQRRLFISRLLRGRLPQRLAHDHLTRVTMLEAVVAPVYPSTAPAQELAAMMLEVHLPELLDSVVVGAANGKGDQLLRTSLALRLAVDDLAMTSTSPSRWADVHGPLLVAHLQFLESAGYQPDELEHQVVNQYAGLSNYLSDD